MVYSELKNDKKGGEIADRDLNPDRHSASKIATVKPASSKEEIGWLVLPVFAHGAVL